MRESVFRDLCGKLGDLRVEFKIFVTQRLLGETLSPPRDLLLTIFGVGVMPLTDAAESKTNSSILNLSGNPASVIWA